MLVYPAGNSAFEGAAQDYREALTHPSTFGAITVEGLLDTHSLHEPATERRFRERYLRDKTPNERRVAGRGDCQ